MLIKFDYKLRICVYFLILFNLIDQLECRKEDKINLLNNENKNDAKENANLQFKNDENLSPKAKYSLNKYFLIYNLIKAKPFKRSISYNQQLTSSKLNTLNNFKSHKRNQLNTNLIDEQTSKNSSLLLFLNLLNNLKRQQPTCNQLKELWDISINKLVDYFLTENNQLFTQSYLNQMNNPIYLALINLIDDKNQHLKILNYNQDYNHLLNNQKDDHLFFNKFLNTKNPYLIQKLPGSRNGQPHYFGDFINNDHNKDSKFIPNPIDRHDHGLEIIEEGPTFMYAEDNKPSDFWSDAQLSKPVNKPEIRY